MCRGCYEEHGSPVIVTEATKAAASLIERVYDFSSVGGNLHVQLDDWNLEDEWFEEFKSFHDDPSPEQLDVERRCFDALKAMSLQERASSLAIFGGYTEPKVA